MDLNGGLSVMDLSASVKLDASSFEKGIASIRASIDTMNANVVSMISTVESLLSVATAAFTVLSTSAGDTGEAVAAALNELSPEEFEQYKSSLDDIVAYYNTNTTKAAKQASEAASGATEAAEETEKAVRRISDAAETGTYNFERFADAAKTVWSVAKLGALAVVDLAVASANVARDVQADEILFNTAFNENAEDAEIALNRISEATGMHYLRIQSNMASVQAQLVSAGYDSETALAMTKDAMLLAADASSVYGLSLDDATSRLLSFLRGNSEAGEAMGLFAMASKREEEAERVFGEKWTDLTETQRQKLMLDLAVGTYEKSGFSGAASELQNTYNNALANLKSQWREIQAIIGTPIVDAISPVFQDLFDLLETPAIKGAIEDFAESLAGLVSTIVDTLTGFIQWAASDDGQQFISNVSGALEWVLGLFGYSEPKTLELSAADYTIDDPNYGMAESPRVEDESGISTEYGNVSIFRESGVFNETSSSASLENRNAIIDALADLFNAALTEDARDDDAAIDLVESTGLFSERMAGYAYDIFDIIESKGLSAFGDETSIDNLINRIIDASEGNTIVDNMQDIVENYNRTSSELSSAIEALPGLILSALSGLSIQLDGSSVGQLVAPTVASVIARNTRYSRYTIAGVQG